MATPDSAFTAGLGGGGIVARCRPQVNAAGWVNLGVWVLKREAFGGIWGAARSLQSVAASHPLRHLDAQEVEQCFELAQRQAAGREAVGS